MPALVCLAVTAVAQEKPAAPGPAAPPTNSAAALNTNAPVVASEVPQKQDIKELIKLPAFTNSVGMIMVKISDLWAGKYEVTQKEYQKVSGANPSAFPDDRKPVDSVSWNEAMNFCRKLTDNEREKEMLPEGFAYMLPTQAQWESLAAGAELQDAVTSSDTARSGTAAVGSLGPNSLGLYDTRGNVWEWCLDPQDKPFRVARGAAWDTSFEVNLRPEFRWYGSPDDAKNMVGFRCVLAPAAN
jgi:formylglycine-generating enzyme required for sulfatase activity